MGDGTWNQITMASIHKAGHKHEVSLHYRHTFLSDTETAEIENARAHISPPAHPGAPDWRVIASLIRKMEDPDTKTAFDLIAGYFEKGQPNGWTYKAYFDKNAKGRKGWVEVNKTVAITSDELGDVENHIKGITSPTGAATLHRVFADDPAAKEILRLTYS